MSAEFNVQCRSCGTIYNDLQDVCPYCGVPQPSTTSALPAEQVIVELPPQAPPLVEETLVASSEDPLPDEEVEAEDPFPEAEPHDLSIYLTPRPYSEEE